ncbi:MAG: hypothetical protein ACKERG_00115 [Candidatus Hodgkinia cicadicola]
METTLPNLDLTKTDAEAAAATKRNKSEAWAAALNRGSGRVLPLDNYSAELRVSLVNSEISELRRSPSKGSRERLECLALTSKLF